VFDRAIDIFNMKKYFLKPRLTVVTCLGRLRAGLGYLPGQNKPKKWKNQFNICNIQYCLSLFTKLFSSISKWVSITGTILVIHIHKFLT
jgi:hypothetical protein